MSSPGSEAPQRVLVVDDDEVDRRFVRRALTGDGVDVDLDEAGTGREAVDLAIQGEYDLILLDYLLPDSTGIDVLAQVRDRGVGTPVIVLTGHGDEDVAVEAMKHGARDYLTKDDLTPTRLRQSTRNVLRAQEMEEEVDRLRTTLTSQEKVALLGVLSETAIEGLEHGLQGLTALFQQLQSVKDELVSDESREAADEFDEAIELQLREMVHLLHVLGSFRRLLVDGPEPRPIDLDERVGKAVRMFARTTPPSIDVVTDLDGADTVELDPQAIHHALLHLLNNASEAMSDGGEIRVVTRANDGTVEIVVEDEGPGVPEDLGESIVDLHVSAKPGHEGIGLTLARHLAETQGGSLSFADRSEGGTRFVLRLPSDGATG